MELGCGCADGFEGAEVEWDEADVYWGGQVLLDGLDCLAGLTLGARREIDSRRAVLGQLGDGFFAEADIACTTGQ